MRRVWVIGAGGHAKVVIDALRASGSAEVAGVLDDDPARLGTTVLGVPVRDRPTREALDRLGAEHAVIAVGSNRARAAIAGRLDAQLSWVDVVHPKAHVAPGACIGAGSVLLAGAIVQPDASVGRHAIINTAATVDHDCRVGDFAHLAPGVRLAGEVEVGEGALLGLGSCVLPGRRVGPWATVGAGGVVVRDIPEGRTALGVPARIGPRP